MVKMTVWSWLWVLASRTSSAVRPKAVRPPGGRDPAGRLAPLHHRAGEGHRRGGGLDRERFAGERRLVEQQVALAQEGVGRDQVARAHVDHVPGDEAGGGLHLPAPITQHASLDRQAAAEQCQRAPGPALLREGQHRVEHEQGGDDGGLAAAAEEQLQEDGELQHPRHGGPELPEQVHPPPAALLGRGVRAVARQSGRGLGGG